MLSINYWTEERLLAAYLVVSATKYFALGLLMILFLNEAFTGAPSSWFVLMPLPFFFVAVALAYVTVDARGISYIIAKRFPKRSEYLLFLLTTFLVLAQAPALPSSLENTLLVAVNAALLLFMTWFVWYFGSHGRQDQRNASGVANR